LKTFSNFYNGIQIWFILANQGETFLLSYSHSHLYLLFHDLSPDLLHFNPMWIDKNFKIDNAPVLYHSMVWNRDIYIDDLLDGKNEFLTFNRFKDIYGIETSFFFTCQWKFYIWYQETGRTDLILQNITEITNENFE
jgi:hypothetical protein